jgi:WS/DGAT C-terminal domain
VDTPGPRRQRLAGRQHFINIHVANIPGPAAPLYLAGARLTEAFPVTPLSGNVTLGVGVLPYTDQLNITVIADRDTCPGLPTFTTGLTNCLSDLTGATTAGHRAARGRPASAVEGRALRGATAGQPVTAAGPWATMGAAATGMPHTLADGAPRYLGATGRLRATPEGARRPRQSEAQSHGEPGRLAATREPGYGPDWAI